MFLAKIIEPLVYGFMIKALLMAALIGAVCALISCYLILKGWSLMGDAISHAVLPGIVIAYLAHIPLGAGAFFAGLLNALLTGWIKDHSRIHEDSVMGTVFTGMMATGLILVTKVRTNVHLMHILFGSLLGIETHDMVQAVICAGITLVVVTAKRKDILLYLFDKNYAKAVGLNVKGIHYLFLSLTALTIVASLQAAGILLTVAMLITPGCIAYLLTDKLDRMLFISSCSAMLSALIGTYVSYYLNGATGACIILVQTLFFVFAMIAAPKYGIVVRRKAFLNSLRTPS
ncbi:metal ABC transporter permease [Treponema parvum]|uniref:Metal ABC transporter permease n=1 Tax=Treponema parvum TaxID=138851 RepID=A0A975F5I7_9SPIR|nr:metal ABC transporter permease [Treponema parvum]QTQ14693.1 metal ABC transporter permease [Treponema parvum]